MCIQDLTTGTGPRVGRAAELAGMTPQEFMLLSPGDCAYWFGRVDGAIAEPVKLAHPMDADPFAPWDGDSHDSLAVPLPTPAGNLIRTYGHPGGYQTEVWVAEDRVTLRDLDRYGAEVRRDVIGPEKLAEMGVTAAEFAKVYEKKPADDEAAE